MSWFNDLIRNFFGWIDAIIYGLINGEYQTFINIAQLTLLDNDAFDTFAQRVYTLIGIFMLFKLAFSLLEMLVSPDVITDKNRGLGKLVQRILVSLILIVSTPFIFNYAFKIQSVVLGQNILANIILGGGYETSDVSSDNAQTSIQNTYEDGGKLMGFSVLNAFLSPNYTALTYPESEQEAAKEALGETLYEKAYVPYLEARKESDINKLLDLKNIKNDGEYVFNYSFFVSSLAGAFVAWIMLMFCLDIGVRMVKLTFLQLVAPIPILSYIDPKTSKVFSSWTKECVKTYLDVFLRLLIIYFVIFILSIILKDGLLNVYRYEWNTTTGELVPVDYTPTFFETALVVIGLLLFAKQAPGLITDMLGIKMSGDFTMNPFSKLQSVPVLGAAGAHAFGRTAGAITAMRKDETGMPISSFLQGWNHAGKQLKGKVSMAGNNPKQAPVRSMQIGRDAAYELVGGDKDKVYNPVALMNRDKASKKIEDLKKNYRNPIQNEINSLDLEMDAYRKQYTDAVNSGDTEKANNISKKWADLNKKKVEAQKHLDTVNDQIKDIKKRYHIDDSTKKTLSEAKDYASGLNDNSNNNDNNNNNNIKFGNNNTQYTIKLPDGRVIRKDGPGDYNKKGDE